MHEICLNVVFGCGIALLVLVMALFVLSRAFIFSHEYNLLRIERKNELWLIEQCKNDKFYHEMKHHSLLCDEVDAKSQENIWLATLERVAKHTYLCGDVSCVDLFVMCIEWATGQGCIFLSVFCLMCFLMPSIMMSVWNTSVRHMTAFSKRKDDVHFYDTLNVHDYAKKGV